MPIPSRTADAAGPPPTPAGIEGYHLLRAASKRFHTDVFALTQAQRQDAEREARRTLEIEGLVLASSEARRVVIPPSQVEAALAEVRGRYPDPDAFAADLRRNGLDLEILTTALRRDLIFDAVMHRVGAQHAEVDEIDQRLFYELHRGSFTRPERRRARHILITVNDSFEENRREAALARIERLAERMKGGPATIARRFGELAREHSECPTALEDGRLGEVGRGQLYPGLDALLFRLEEGQVGGPVETELGFHLIWCERIQREQTLPFSKVRETIRQTLQDRRRRSCQKAWLAELRQAARAGALEPV